MNPLIMPMSSAFGSQNALSGVTPAQIAALNNIQPLSNLSDASVDMDIGAIAPQFGQEMDFGGLSLTEGLNLGLSGVATLGGLWNAFQANKLAKKQFNFNKRLSTANMQNSIQDYNTKLADRARARAHTEGTGQAAADSYVEKNRLKDFPG